MTIELKDTINDDAKYEYRDFCSCVRNQIIDAYKTYLQSIIICGKIEYGTQ
jgi:hypothetical protein